MQITMLDLNRENSCKKNQNITFKQISSADMVYAKKEIETTLQRRNFSPKIIQSIKSKVNSINYDLVKMLSNDRFCHSAYIDRCSWIGVERPDDGRLDKMLKAAEVKDYVSLMRLYGAATLHEINCVNITDCRPYRTKEYRPTWKKLYDFSPSVFERIKQDILYDMDKIKDLYPRSDDFYNPKDIESKINNENIRLLSTLAGDVNCNYWILEYAARKANIETEELMRYAASKGQYELIYPISEGDYYDKKDLDIAIRLNKEKKRREEDRYQNPWKHSCGCNQQQQTYDNQFRGSHYNYGSSWYNYEPDGFVDEQMKEQFRNMFRDRFNSERNYNSTQWNFNGGYSNHEQDTQTQNRTNAPVKWTREQFLEHINGVLFKRKFKTRMLKDSEVRNLAKLLNTTEDQIRNMDKAEYARLSKKYHPDIAQEKDKILFSIINVLFHNKY